jgi:hypothetical protein
LEAVDVETSGGSEPMKNEAVSKLDPSLEEAGTPVIGGSILRLLLPETGTDSSGPGEIVDLPLRAGIGFKRVALPSITLLDLL